MKARYVIGIDEAGRGPLAGPVSVGAVIVEAKKLRALEKLFSAAKDSKMLSHEKREEIFTRMMAEMKKSDKACGGFRFAVSFSSAAVIDKKGIVPAIRAALAANLKKLGARPQECRVLLDGSLRAPEVFTNQETIIRGDQSEKIISLASIAAKVLRDRHMVRLSAQYPAYGFDIHKGYGTFSHRQTLVLQGPCVIHRKSFLRKMLGAQAV